MFRTTPIEYAAAYKLMMRSRGLVSLILVKHETRNAIRTWTHPITSLHWADAAAELSFRTGHGTLTEDIQASRNTS